MKLLLVASLLLSGLAYAENNLKKTGFKLIKDSEVARIYHYENKDEYIISKARFGSAVDAKSFCAAVNSQLDTEYNALGIFYSGASKEDKFLKDSISFKFNNRSGIWQWIGTNENIYIMINGQGRKTHEVELEELNRLTKVALPAICVKML